MITDSTTRSAPLSAARETALKPWIPPTITRLDPDHVDGRHVERLRKLASRKQAKVAD